MPTSRRSNKPKRSAYEHALAMLARREYSRHELRVRLQHAGYDPEESETALRRLREEGYQDECRFGDMIVRARVGQGYGPARIRAELRSHQLADDAIDTLIDAAGVDWEQLAVAQVRKKYGSAMVSDPATRAKHMAFLARRGFAAATVRIAVQSRTGASDYAD
jgi:regulatory protein